MPSYHLLNTSTSSHLERENEADLLVAGDGVYSAVRCMGMSIPFPFVLCEIRGLLPLAQLLFLGEFPLERNEKDAFEHFPVPFAPSHHVLTHPGLPALDASRIYQYIIAREGVFLLAGCSGMEVLMPISPTCELPGLASVSPYIKWKYPLIGENMVQELFDRARGAKDEQGHMLERLFYLTHEEDGWHIYEPEQVQSATRVQATVSSETDEMALIEGHSHHDMPAYFSSTDNQDEVINGGFKIYFVLGRVHAQPQIRTRICVHGYCWEVPAEYFFALPAGIQDCVGTSWVERWP